MKKEQTGYPHIDKSLNKMEKIDKDTISIKMQNILNTGLEVVILVYIKDVNYKEYLEYKEIINYNILQILNEENISFADTTQTVYVKNI